MARVLNHVLNKVLPQACYLCGASSVAHPVCAPCELELPRHPAAVCPVCALPTAEGAVCGRCLNAMPGFDATRTAFDYAFPLDVLIQALKYRHRLSLAGFFASRLSLPADADLILPMPLHPRRLAGRGFNQAVEIARPLARASGLPMELSAVVRLRDTSAQAQLGREDRVRNLRGAFACDRRLDGLCVVVIDDVMTTGASLDELARCLKASGAARVENCVVARTPTPL